MSVCVREGSRSHRVYAWRPEAGMVVSLPPALFIEGGRVSHVVWLDSLLLGRHLHLYVARIRGKPPLTIWQTWTLEIRTLILKFVQQVPFPLSQPKKGDSF